MAFGFQTYLDAHPDVVTNGNAITALMDAATVAAFKAKELAIYKLFFNSEQGYNQGGADWDGSWEAWYKEPVGLRWFFYYQIGKSYTGIQPANGYPQSPFAAMLPEYMGGNGGASWDKATRQQAMLDWYNQLWTFYRAHALTDPTAPTATVPDTQNGVTPTNGGQTGSPPPASNAATNTTPLDNSQQPATPPPSSSMGIGILVLAVVVLMLMGGKK